MVFCENEGVPEQESDAPGSNSASRRRARRGEGDALRQELLYAARSIVEDDGDAHGVTIRRVAARAGVSQSAVYLHFSSRDELVYDAAYQTYIDHDHELEVELRRLKDPKDRVDRRGRGYVDFALKYPSLFHVLLMGNGSERTPHRFDGYEFIQRTNLRGLIDDVRESMEAGRIEPGSPELTSALLWMAVHGVASLQISIPNFPWPPPGVLMDSMLDLLRKGLGETPNVG